MNFNINGLLAYLYDRLKRLTEMDNNYPTLSLEGQIYELKNTIKIIEEQLEKVGK